MSLLRNLIVAGASVVAFAVSAAECSRQEAIAAEETASTLRTWPALHSTFVRYRHCDDGAIGEGFSESVSILVADHWGDLKSLSNLTAKDRSFLQFVLRHLDETVPADRLARIEANAKDRCPVTARSLCNDILSRSQTVTANSAVNTDAPKTARPLP